MKNLLHTLVFSLILLPVLSAQDNFRPNPRELGIALKATGFGPLKDDLFEDAFSNTSLQVRYNKTDLLTYRVEFGVKGDMSTVVNRLTFGSGNNITNQETKTTIRQLGLTLSPGMEYHFEGTPKLDPYVGSLLHLSMMGKKKTTSISDTKTDTVFSDNIQSENIQPGSLEYGLQVFTGFNYYIADRFALGLEYSFGFMTERTGGTTSSSTTRVTKQGGNTNTTTQSSESFTRKSETEVKNFGVLSLNLVYFFGSF